MTLNKIFKKGIQQLGKILIIISISLSITNVANAQSKQKLAVYVTGDSDAGTKKVIGAKLVSAITKNDGYAAVERTADFLSELNKEYSYQQSGAVDDRQLARLGQQFGVAFVCVADVSMVYGSTFIAARMINVNTGLIIATVEKDKEINGMADLTVLSEEVAEELFNNVAPCTKKGKSADKKNCCDGLVAIDGVCSDLNEYVKTKCGLEIMLKKSNNEKCPDGWRTPTVDDLVSLSKIQEVLSTIIPIRTYGTNMSYDDTHTRTIYYKSKPTSSFEKGYYSGGQSTTCGERGYYSVDLQTGSKNRVCTYKGECKSYVEDNNISQSYAFDLPYPPFWVR